MKKITKMSKKIISLLIICILLATTAIQPCSVAKAADTQVIKIGNGYYIEETIDEYISPGISTYALSTTKTKTCTVKNRADNVVAIYKLTGKFSYGTGAPATCTSATYTTTKKNSTVSFTAATAYKEKNVAYGSFSLKYTYAGGKQTYSHKINITCSVNGVTS